MKHNDIKDALETISLDDYSETRLKTKVKLKLNEKKAVSGIKKTGASFVALFCALAIVLSLGFIDISNTLSKKSAESTELKIPAVKNLIVMASAAEKDNTVTYKELKMNDEFPYEMYMKVVRTADMSVEERNAAFLELDAEYEKYINNRSNFWNISHSSISSYENAAIMVASIGSLKLNIENSEDVIEIKAENTSKYVNLTYDNTNSANIPQLREEGKSLRLYYLQTPVLTISAEDFDFEDNSFFWETTEELGNEFNDNINTPFSTFNDEVTFTVKYKNGDIAKAVIKLEFNQDGSSTVKAVDF